MYEANDVDWIHLLRSSVWLSLQIRENNYTTALDIFPIMVISKTRLRPYLSDNAPI